MDPSEERPQAETESSGPPNAPEAEQAIPNDLKQEENKGLTPLSTSMPISQSSAPPSTNAQNAQWNSQAPNSATPPPEAQPTQSGDANNTLASRPSVTQFAPVQGFGPPGMQSVPLGNGAFWIGPPGQNPQGQVVYTGNTAWFNAQQYVNQQQQNPGRSNYPQMPGQQFYTSGGLPINQQAYAQLQMSTGPNAGGQQPSAQPNSSQAQQANSQGLQTLVGQMQKSSSSEAQYPAGSNPHLTAQQFAPPYMPGSFLSQMPGAAIVQGGQGDQQGPSPGHLQHAVMQAAQLGDPNHQQTDEQAQANQAQILQWAVGSQPQQTWTVPPQRNGASGMYFPGPLQPTILPQGGRELSLNSHDIAKQAGMQPSRPQVIAPGRTLNVDGSLIIPPGKVKQNSAEGMRPPFSSAEGATGPDGEPLYFQPVRGACSRRRKSSTNVPKEEQPDPQNSSESWSFLPGVTSTGKRRRRHPVAEVKGNWTPEEDAKLIELVKKHGEGNWSKLLPEFKGRIGKQLRERWNHELRPDISKEGWTHDEECGLIEAHKIHGNCWAEIAKTLAQQNYPRRTQNGIKNHWHATARKVSRAPPHANPSTPLQAYLRALNRKQGEPMEGAPVAGKVEVMRMRVPEEEEEQQPAKRAKPVKVANDDFHLKFDRPAERSLTPEARDAGQNRQRAPHNKRLNAEELAVADGLLGLGTKEAAKKGSESTDSAEDDSSPPPQPARSRRLPVQATTGISAQAGTRRKRQARLDEVDDRFRCASEEQQDIENLNAGSLVAIVANAASVVDKLKKVGADTMEENCGPLLEKAMKEGKLADLEKYILEEAAKTYGPQHAGQGLHNMVKQFAGLPKLWDLYDTLKNEGKHV